MNTNNGNGPQTFPTPEAAAAQAKTDLLAVLRSGKNINLGLDAALIERSQPGTPVKQYQLTFDDLQSADSAGLKREQQNELSTVVPLVADNSTATVVEVAADEKGWRVASLATKNIAVDLNTLSKLSRSGNGSEITIYRLPHSAFNIYSVRQGQSELFHTDYPGFNLREGVTASRLLQVLKGDAALFQRQHGSQLKEKKLVH